MKFKPIEKICFHFTYEKYSEIWHDDKSSFLDLKKKAQIQLIDNMGFDILQNKKNSVYKIIHRYCSKEDITLKACSKGLVYNSIDQLEQIEYGSVPEILEYIDGMFHEYFAITEGNNTFPESLF